MADGPGGKEVGRVYIRVLPNTAEFATRLKAAVKGMSDKVEVDVDLDTAKAEAKLKALTKTREKITLITEADTTRAKAQVEQLAADKNMTVMARAVTEKAARKLDQLMENRRNLNIRVDVITAAAKEELKALSRKRTAVVDAKLNDASIAKAEARIQALDRRQQLILSLDTKQVTKRYNRLKAQMRHLTSQLNIQTDPAALARIRTQLEAASKGFKIMGEVKLKGRDQVIADIESLKKRYNVVIDLREKQFENKIRKVHAQMDAVEKRRDIHLQAVFDGASAKGEYEAWQRSFVDQVKKIGIQLNTAQATVDWEEYKALLERSRVELNADLNTARASVQSDALKQQIEGMRVSIEAMLDPKSRENVRAQIAIMSRDYKFALEAKLQDAQAKFDIENLAKDRTAYFKAVLDTKKAMVQFSALERDRVADLHIRLRDNLKAQAEMIALGEDRTVDFKAVLKDEKKIAAELAWLTRDRTIHVKMKTDFKTKFFQKFFDKFNGNIKRSQGLLGGFTTLAKGAAAGLGGALSSGIGLALGKTSELGSAFTDLGKSMMSSVTSSLPQLAMAAVQAGVVLGGLLAIGGALLALFAGLAATILSVAAALLGMVAAVAMLAVALIAAAVGVAALAALPAIFAGVALMASTWSDGMAKQFDKLKDTLQDVLDYALQPMVEAFEREIPKLNTWLTSMKGDFRDAFSAAAKHLDSLRVALQQFVGQLVPKLTKAMNDDNFQTFMDAISGTGKRLGLFGNIGKALGKTFEVLAQNGDKFAVVANEMGRGLLLVLPAMAEFISATATGAEKTGQIANGIAKMFTNLADSFNAALSSDGWGETVKGISDLFASLGESIGTGFEVAMRNGDSFGKAFRAIGKTFEVIAEPLANFTASGAEQFAAVMPSVDEGLKKIIPSMQGFTEAFAKFAPGVVTTISNALAELFDYLAQPEVAAQCAEITKALVQLVKTVLGPQVLDAMLSMSTIALDLANMLAPIIPLLIQFFMLSTGFKAVGAMAGAFGGNLLKVGTALETAGGKTGRLGSMLTTLGTRFKSVGTALKGGLTSALTSIGTNIAKIGPKFATIGRGAATAAASFTKASASMLLNIGRVVAVQSAAMIKMAAGWLIGLGPIFWIGVAIAALVALVIVYWDEICAAAEVAWNWIYTNVVQPVIDLIMAIFQPFIDWISENWIVIQTAAQMVWDMIMQIIDLALAYIKLIFDVFITTLTTPWMLIWTAVQVVWAIIWAYIQSVFAVISGIFSLFIGQLVAGWNLLVGVVMACWNFIWAIIQGVIDIVMGIFDIFVGILTGDWDLVQAGASRVWKGIQGIIDGFCAWVMGIFKSVVGFFSSSWENIQGVASDVWDSIQGAFSGAMDSIRDACASAIQWVIDKFNSLKDKAGAVLSKLNPANWFSASLDMDVNTPSVSAMSIPLTLSAPAASTFASLTKDNPWRDEVQTFASGVGKADSAFNASLAVASGLNSDSSGSTAPASRGGDGVTVNVETNANPFQIGKEVAWALRRK